jgi:DNA-binding response OmpR family regulator
VGKAGRVLSFEQILFSVWGSEYKGNDDYVHVYVSHLRSKIEPDPKKPHYIRSIYGVGYIFEKQDFIHTSRAIGKEMFISSESV